MQLLSLPGQADLRHMSWFSSSVCSIAADIRVQMRPGHELKRHPDTSSDVTRTRVPPPPGHEFRCSLAYEFRSGPRTSSYAASHTSSDAAIRIARSSSLPATKVAYEQCSYTSYSMHVNNVQEGRISFEEAGGGTLRSVLSGDPDSITEATFPNRARNSITEFDRLIPRRRALEIRQQHGATGRSPSETPLDSQTLDRLIKSSTLVRQFEVTP